MEIGRPLLILLLALGFVSGCAHRKPAVRGNYPPPPRPQPQPVPSSTPSQTQAPPNPPPPAPGAYVQDGLASWYGVPFHGHRAADGEIYNMYQLTAAHRTLPFNAMVRVTNLANGRQVVVRIIDRGPFVEGRIIDLSLAAARSLDMVGVGVVPARLEMLSGPNPYLGYFAVQVGAFLLKENAERLRDRLAQRYQPVFIQEYDSPTGLFYRVRVGRVTSEDEARRFAQQLQAQEQLIPFVVRVDQ